MILGEIWLLLLCNSLHNGIPENALMHFKFVKVVNSFTRAQKAAKPEAIEIGATGAHITNTIP